MHSSLLVYSYYYYYSPSVLFSYQLYLLINTRTVCIAYFTIIPNDQYTYCVYRILYKLRSVVYQTQRLHHSTLLLYHDLLVDGCASTRQDKTDKNDSHPFYSHLAAYRDHKPHNQLSLLSITYHPAALSPPKKDGWRACLLSCS